MIGVFSIAFVGKSSSVWPLNEIVASLWAVPATCPAAHMIVLEVPPSLFELIVPEGLSPHTGITPGEIVVMEAVIFINSHPVPYIRVCIQFLSQAGTHLPGLFRIGNIHIFCSPDGNRFQILGPHDRSGRSSGA